MNAPDVRAATETRPAAPRTAVAPPAPGGRPEVRGPSLFLDGRRFVVKAVTYGTFAADAEGALFPPRARVREDFQAMRRAAVNTVRTYTAPPDWFMEEARQAGLRVLVGIYWDGRDCVFDDRRARKAAAVVVEEAVRRLCRFPDVVLAYVIGNEIPPLVARFHGRRTIERFLEHLYRVAKRADPGGLVTYGNYPTTEFLQLHFLDFLTMNVYLLEPPRLAAYLDRLMVESKGKPLLLGEVGDDSQRRGEAWQAELLDWTIPLALDKGVAGLCVFSWTDEWVVGGHEIDDWAFGLTRADRSPKPSLEVAGRRFTDSAFEGRAHAWPRVSVVVCNYNGGRTLDETLTSLGRLDYPDYEVILVEDGSTDDSLEIARRHEGHVRILVQENRGLGVARNVGLEAATGEIVAYIDSDAFADPEWLRFLVLALEMQDAQAAGGPNLTPDSDGFTAQLIALCPGNPTHVLKDNTVAEHVAGVNMAFRRDALLAVGGFDPVHRRAGDDVDVCWKLEDAGLKIAFAPAAIVWHHRRPSIRTYFRQQYGYGEAEHQLETKYPARFNLAGSIRWNGRVYLAPRKATRLFRPFIYHGRLGTSHFQTLYQKDPSYLLDGPRMVQWYVVWGALLLLAPFVSPWLLVPALGMMALSMWVALVAGHTTEMPVALPPGKRLEKTWTIALLHFVHPIVRGWGRARTRLRHWRELRAAPRLGWLRPDRVVAEIARMFGRGKEVRRYWGPGSTDREGILGDVQAALLDEGRIARMGQDWDNHDLLLDSWLASRGRLFTAPEHYDQALCVGFRAQVTWPARIVLALTLAATAALTLADSAFTWTLALPALVLWYDLGQRNRVRAAAWRAVEKVMSTRGAKRFQA